MFLNRAEHYGELAKRYLRLAAADSTKNRNHYLRIAVQYSSLAEAEDLSTQVRREHSLVPPALRHRDAVRALVTRCTKGDNYETESHQPSCR